MRTSTGSLMTAIALASLSMTSHAAERGMLIDLVAVDSDAQVEALKRSPGASWWVEAGEVLLLAGDVATLRGAVPARLLLREIDSLRLDRLALRPRGCGDHRQALAEQDLLLVADTFELVHQPIAFAPAGLNAGTINPHLGVPEFQPVAANSTIARLHRFDRPQGAATVDPGIAPVVDRVDAARWFATVGTLTGWDRSSWSAQLPLARQWIAGEFAQLGLSVSEPTFSFPPGGTPAPIANVIGVWSGSETPDEWIVVGGHYDSRNINNNAASASNTPGADDNASGCSGVIEAARAVVPFRPKLSVLFMCYAGEEQGLYGSHGHVNALTASGDLGRVKAMLNMDMIGWTPDTALGVNIATNGNPSQPGANTALVDLLADSALTYAPTLNANFVVKQYSTCCSDHMPYINAGRPATMSIHRGTTSYPHYHRSTDTPSNLGPQAQDIGSAIVRMNVAALARLSGASDVIFSDGNEGP